MIVYVICTLGLLTNLSMLKVVQVEGKLISDNQEIWIVDISEFILAHSEFRNRNNMVQIVNNNLCIFKEQK